MALQNEEKYEAMEEDTELTPKASTSTSTKRSFCSRLCPKRSLEKCKSQECMRKARKALEDDKYEDAITHFTTAYGLSPKETNQYEALCGRADAYVKLCRSILHRPAKESEESALVALEPSSYARLAMQDADAALRIDCNAAEALQLKGQALLLLERYPCARGALEAALFSDPNNAAAQQGLAEIEAALAAMESVGDRSVSNSRRRLNTEQCDDLDCILCMKLLFEPVTTPCGHSFCKPCFSRCTDHPKGCTICRTVLHVGRELPVTVTLKSIIEKNFPEECEARRREECCAGCEGEEPPLPLFVMSSLLPGERMGLQIFEPRYRLMVRRCMEGSRRFGMAVRMEGADDVEPFATEAEITECSLMPDGRYHLEIVGRRRAQLLRTWEQDGYRIGQPVYFTDDPLPCPAAELPSGTPTTVEAMCLARQLLEDCKRWTDSLKGVAQNRRAYRALELLYRAGNQPPLEQVEAFSFWAACLLPTLDIRMRMELMRERKTQDRMRRIQLVLQGATESFPPDGCNIM